MKKIIYNDHSHLESVSIEQHPVAEVVEFNETSLTLVNRVEKLFHIWHRDFVCLEDVLGFVEFGKR